MQASRQAERNFGIDLLRLVAMFFVVILHVLGHGGILNSAKGSGYYIAYFIETCAFCAVDCYAIISGFVCYSEEEKPYKYTLKFLKFWAQVVTYSFGIALAVYILKPETVEIVTLIKCALPIATNQYWYASAYVGLIFVIPWINKLMRECSQKQCSQFTIILMLVFVLYETLSADPFTLSNGYSFVWLVIMYILGAWMKKCSIPDKFKSWKLLFVSFLCILLTWALMLFAPKIIRTDKFLCYTSITIVFVAFSLVAVFSKLQLSNEMQKFVVCFAPAAFGVYLIHENQFVKNHYISGSFTWIAESKFYLLPIEAILSAFGIFFICLLIDKVRLLLFKNLGIDNLIARLSQKIDDAIYNKLN